MDLSKLSEYYQHKDAKLLFFPNKWPESELGSEMKRTLQSYYRAMEQLSLTLARIFELTLKLPGGYISGKLDRHTSILSLNHYPPLHKPSDVKLDQLRLARHTDLDLFTIVAQDGQTSGLEIQMRESESHDTSSSSQESSAWVSIEPRKDALVVNIGDGLMYWTNGRWKSTPHRVSVPRLSELPASSR